MKLQHIAKVATHFAIHDFCENLGSSLGNGKKDGGPNCEEVEHIDAIFTLLRYIYDFRVADYIPCLRGLDLDGNQGRVKEAIKIMNKYHNPIIEQRIKEWNDGSKIDCEDFLDILISLKDAHNNPLLTTQQIKAQIIELMMATVDNPSNAVEWGLAEMINQPKLLQRAIEELDKVKVIKLKYKMGKAAKVPFNAKHIPSNEESLGTRLLLQFAPGAYFPSKQHLLVTFYRFGPLNVSETKMLKEIGSAQVVFVRSKDAVTAFYSLENNKFTFGSLLLHCKLHQTGSMAMPSVTSTLPITSIPMPITAETRTPPSLHFLEKNLQIMASTLENSGNSISPQIRHSLDAQIKNLMGKVNCRLGHISPS
ncbi:hypothetical protein VNO78_22379 [Psophocarpus tetragonolobus]|uniref:Uncharacterized protein n=1 Tax=Psophocarpus tetragonolobus TaxID=3891 RepID=A0AAN9SEU7_PSOTE